MLVLADGTKFLGRSIGAEGIAVGEVVFNTSLTGYQEILTDPSYFNQIINFTYPHIGNIGTNEIDNESNSIQAKGLIVRDQSIIASNYRNTLSLSDFIKKQNIISISDIDTRKLTCLLRQKGAQNGCIIAGDVIDENLALHKARTFFGMKDLAKEVSTTNQYSWTQGNWNIENDFVSYSNFKYHIVAYDYGIKRSIMRMLVDRGCRITVVPAQTTAEKVLYMDPDGILLSNGPGDPMQCNYAIIAIKKLLKNNIPIFGICLGYQLLAIASGAKTVKMKFGHHGGNHPVKDLLSDRVMITAQNHNFTVDKMTLPITLKMTHISLFDGTLQGIHRTDKPAFGFQGHPEAGPGPHDATLLFDHFINLIHNYRSKEKV